ncbi:MAG: hypothetical protein WC341_14295 [Bacteroidales bacterium]
MSGDGIQVGGFLLDPVGLLQKVPEGRTAFFSTGLSGISKTSVLGSSGFGLSLLENSLFKKLIVSFLSVQSPSVTLPANNSHSFEN